ncbi:MAG: response regulator [Thermodesulfovibrionales bacterium]|nr:response regulator [Thermodesulfovibrionales bacterium]
MALIVWGGYMPQKILIVEDNENNRRLVREVLVYYGYETIEAGNGEEGIKIAKEHKPDLIFMDIQMPVMNGYEAIKSLKNDPDTKHIKIVALTSFAMLGDREKSLEAGADDYMAKPINTRELPEKVKKLLSEDI